MKISPIKVSFFVSLSVLSLALSMTSAVHAKCKSYQAFVPEDMYALKYFESKDFGAVDIIYSNNVDPDSNSLEDIRKLKAYLTAKQFSSDIIVLDWEGESFKTLKEETVGSSRNAATQKRILVQYKHAVQILSEHVGPSIRTGYYGIPSKKFSEADKPIADTPAINNLQTSVDSFFPSGYLSLSRNGRSNKVVVVKYLQAALDKSCELGSQAYVFVNHRWHKRSKLNPLALIPPDRFSSLVREISELRSKNCSYAGIIWWSADFRLMQKGNQNIVNELRDYREDYDNYFDMVLKSYADTLKLHCK